MTSSKTDAIRLRPPVRADVPLLYELQSDPEANRMAGTKPRPREAFFAVWEKIFADPRVNARVIEFEGQLVGGVSVFQAPAEVADESGVTPMQDCFGYWVARAFWGRGIASRAGVLFLEREELRRPLHATAARANVASIRVLEKCGFRFVCWRMGEETERYVGCEVGEFVLG